MKKNIFTILFILGIIMAGCTISDNLKNKYIQDKQSKQEENIKIGVIIPLSGNLANFGADINKGIQLYEKQNSKCNYIIEDDVFDPKKSLNAYKKLLNVDKIKIFIGPFGPSSSQTIYSSQNPQQLNENTFIAMSTCTQEFREYKNMLCTYPSPVFQIEESFKYMKKENLKSFYTITSNDAIGEIIENLLKNISKKNNIENKGLSKINLKDNQYQTTTTKAIQSNPEFIYISTTSPQTNIKLTKELKEKQYKGKIIIGSDIEESLVKEFNQTLENVYFLGIAKIDYEPIFKSKFKQEYQEEPNLYSSYGYLLSSITCELAINNSDGFNTQDIITFTNLHKLAIKDFKFNKYKEVELPMMVLQAKNGDLNEVFVS